MLPDEKIYCHRTGFQKTCFECVTGKKCQLWMQLQMINPQTGEQMDRWGCKDALELLINLDHGKKLNELAGSFDGMRNEHYKAEMARRLDFEQALTAISPAQQLKELPHAKD